MGIDVFAVAVVPHGRCRDVSVRWTPSCHRSLDLVAVERLAAESRRGCPALLGGEATEVLVSTAGDEDVGRRHDGVGDERPLYSSEPAQQADLRSRPMREFTGPRGGVV